MEQKDLPKIMDCQRCDGKAMLVKSEYEEHYVQCELCSTSTNDFCPSDFTVEEEKPWDSMPILMAIQAAVNDWNDLQELIRKGKHYDEMKELLTAMIPVEKQQEKRRL